MSFELYDLLKTLLWCLTVLGAFVLGYKFHIKEPLMNEPFPEELIDLEEAKEEEEEKEAELI